MPLHHLPPHTRHVGLQRLLDCLAAKIRLMLVLPDSRPGPGAPLALALVPLALASLALVPLALAPLAMAPLALAPLALAPLALAPLALAPLALAPLALAPLALDPLALAPLALAPLALAPLALAPLALAPLALPAVVLVHRPPSPGLPPGQGRPLAPLHMQLRLAVPVHALQVERLLADSWV